MFRLDVEVNISKSMAELEGEARHLDGMWAGGQTAIVWKLESVSLPTQTSNTFQPFVPRI